MTRLRGRRREARALPRAEQNTHTRTRGQCFGTRPATRSRERARENELARTSSRERAREKSPASNRQAPRAVGRTTGPRVPSHAVAREASAKDARYRGSVWPRAVVELGRILNAPRSSIWPRERT